MPRTKKRAPPRPPWKGYGTCRDRPDRRDARHAYSIPSRFRHRLPPLVDLRRQMPPVYNQRHLNSCSAHAIAAALWFNVRRDHPGAPAPSRLFTYYQERLIEGKVSIDCLVSLRDGYKTVKRDGVCPERAWPYDIRRFRRQPPAACYAAAQHHRAIRFRRIQRSLTHLKACLAEGYPFAFGLAVHQSFKSRLVKRTGVVPLPIWRDRFRGGHAMLAVGYMDDSQHFIVRNSWGAAWGYRGYCYVPYRYMLNPDLTWDMWTVRRLT